MQRGVMICNPKATATNARVRDVITRALGSDLKLDVVEATSEILDALRSGRRRRVNLGTANDRFFTFCAGVGIDAEVVRVVERHRRNGRNPTAGLYIRSAVRHF